MEQFNNGKQLKRMVRRFVKGRATPQESDFLDEWDRYLNTHHDVFADLPQHERDAIRDTMLNGLKSAIHEPKRKKIFYYRWLPYAAAILVAVTAAIWMFYGNQIDLTSKFARPESADIAPGTNRATLTLADGRKIDLSSEQAGIIVADGITYLDGSQVMADEELVLKHDRADGENGIRTAQLSPLNSITIPNGGTYRVTLPDGSHVWLNAASTLKYPSQFESDERVVFLEGEGYFDISHHLQSTAKRLPFRVVTNGQTVEVLGTAFNISAYPDENVTTTTLVEGRVAIENGKSKMVNRLSPGQQAILDDGVLRIQKADVEQATDWKNGKFTFNQMDFQSAMARIARWYDVEVSYEGDFTELAFGGSVSRGNTLRQTLNILESTGNMKFKIEGRRVVVMP